jgi:hypothetical protein
MMTALTDAEEQAEGALFTLFALYFLVPSLQDTFDWT